jgi:hypothetical protein
MESGDDNEIFARFGMNADGIVRQVQDLLARKRLRN